MMAYLRTAKDLKHAVRVSIYTSICGVQYLSPMYDMGLVIYIAIYDYIVSIYAGVLFWRAYVTLCCVHLVLYTK